jgi:prophage maintenance system killer protein
MPENSVVLFTDGTVSLDVPVSPERDTVWLNRNQMAQLFERDVKTIGKHINNAMAEELNDLDDTQENPTVAKFATVQNEGGRRVERSIEYYSLDVIISVGYRVKSKRGIAFRRWANSVLKEYVLKGYAANKQRLNQLNQVITIISRSDNQEIAGISSVLERFVRGLDMLDRYDHESLQKPQGKEGQKAGKGWRLTYEEGIRIIGSLKFGDESELFGNEKDNSFKSAINAIYQGFDGKDLYPTDQEKAAHLLYFLVKNHAFFDGNKRIAAALFVHFLDKNGLLYTANGRMVIDNNALAAMTLMIALSRPEEKDTMCLLVTNMLENN